MIGKEKAGKAYLSVLHRLEQLHLRVVIGIKAQDAGGKDDGFLTQAAGLFCNDAVEFSGIDEIQAFGTDRKLLHVDL